MTQTKVDQNQLQVTAGEHQITWAPILWAQRDLKLAWNDGFIASDRLFIALHRFVLTFWFHKQTLDCRNLGALKAGLLPSPCFPNFLARTTFVLVSLSEVKIPGQDAIFGDFVFTSSNLQER